MMDASRPTSSFSHSPSRSVRRSAYVTFVPHKPARPLQVRIRLQFRVRAAYNALMLTLTFDAVDWK